MSISKIRENARIALTGKWGKGACITLAYLAFFFVIGLLTGVCEGIFGEESLMVNLLGILTAIIQVPIVFGLGYAFIKLKRNEEVKAFDFLNLGFSNFGRSWKIGLRTLLKMILPMFLVIMSIVLFAFSITSYMLSSLAGTTADATAVIVALIVYIAAIIYTVVVSLLYTLTTFIAYDNPYMLSLDVVNESKRMMKGNRGKIFLLELSFIGWAILAVFSFGIGYLWLLPYMQVAIVCFYEHVSGKNENNNSEGNVDAIKEM